MEFTVGIDVGGTKILGVSRALDGTIIEELRVATAYEPEALISAMADVATKLSVGRAIGLGVGIAGMVTNSGSVRYSPNLDGIVELEIRYTMQERTQLPTVVDNDANLAGYAELADGAATGCRHALVVTLGTGIGGALIVDGDIVRGANGFAGEIGHWTVERDGPLCVCGESGHWEAIASGSALGRMGKVAQAEGRLGVVGHVDGHAIGLAARDGDAGALRVLAEFADNVAIGLAGLATIFDPERIIIGGGVVELGALLFEPLTAAFVKRLGVSGRDSGVKVLPAVLGERAGAIGAAAFAARSVV